AIRGAAEIMEDASITPEQRARFLANIHGETVRIQELVDRMLKLTELEARRALGSREAVALATLVRTIFECVEPALGKKQLQTHIDIAGIVTIPGDSMLLHSAVSNLVQNAIDFSPRGGRIAVSCAAAGSMIELRVEDEGPGIPDFARARL